VYKLVLSVEEVQAVCQRGDKAGAQVQDEGIGGLGLGATLLPRRVCQVVQVLGVQQVLVVMPMAWSSIYHQPSKKRTINVRPLYL